eukprot:278097_1
MVILFSLFWTLTSGGFSLTTIQHLETLVSKSYLVRHNFLKCFESGDFANMTEAASIFATNHYVYSFNDINYLKTIASKIEKKDISHKILDNIDSELGTYKQNDIDTLTSMGIQHDWYNKIPHNFLNERFFKSLGIKKESIPTVHMYDEYYDNDTDNNNCECKENNLYNTQNKLYNPSEHQIAYNNVQNNGENNEIPGAKFSKYMIHLYKNINPCEALSIIIFTTKHTLSKMYEYIWNGLINYTDLDDENIVFFPLNIINNKKENNNLMKIFEYYLSNENLMCRNVELIVNDVLNKRIKMYDDIRNEIELKQGYKCQLPYSSKNIENNNKQNNDSLLHNKMRISAHILAHMLAENNNENANVSISCKYNYRNDKFTMLINDYNKPLEYITNNDFFEVDSDLNIDKDIKCIVNIHMNTNTEPLIVFGRSIEEAIYKIHFNQTLNSNQELAQVSQISFKSYFNELSEIIAKNN